MKANSDSLLADAWLSGKGSASTLSRVVRTAQIEEGWLTVETLLETVVRDGERRYLGEGPGPGLPVDIEAATRRATNPVRIRLLDVETGQDYEQAQTWARSASLRGAMMSGVWTHGSSTYVLLFNEEDVHRECRGELPVAAAPTPAVPENYETYSVSDGYRIVDWYGVRYEFTEEQGRIIEVLLDDFECTKGMGLAQIVIAGRAGLNETQCDNFRMRDRFKHHPAWDVLIQRAGKGIYRLVRPQARAAGSADPS